MIKVKQITYDLSHLSKRTFCNFLEWQYQLKKGNYEYMTLSDITEDNLWVAKLSEVNKTEELLRKHSTPLEYKDLKRRV